MQNKYNIVDESRALLSVKKTTYYSNSIAKKIKIKSYGSKFENVKAAPHYVLMYLQKFFSGI